MNYNFCLPLGVVALCLGRHSYKLTEHIT